MRDIPDSERRFEGGKWYCSQSCFLTAESSAASSLRKPSRPRRKWRRRIGWTLGVIVALVVGLGVVGAFVGSSDGSKKGKTHTASGTLHYVKHKPLLGSRLRPIPLGHAAVVRGPFESAGPWRVKVTKVDFNAHIARGSINGPLPKGAQDVVITVSVRYLGGGSGSPEYLANRMKTIGKHEARYDTYCIPSHELSRVGSLFSEQAVSGNLCYEIAKNDASSLLLFVEQDATAKAASQRKWFRLR